MTHILLCIFRQLTLLAVYWHWLTMVQLYVNLLTIRSFRKVKGHVSVFADKML